LRVEDWGLIDYRQAAHRQLEYVWQIIAQSSKNKWSADDDVLIFCQHPPVVTMGRGTKPGDVFSWSGEVCETSRGGRATYHGPSQIVVYPILNLALGGRQFIPSKNLNAFMRALEQAIVDALREFQIVAEARTVKVSEDSPSLTGVWVGEKKIASIGIAVKKWVTYHGLALNFSYDAGAFQGINPCGFQSPIMTSVEEITSNAIERLHFVSVFKNILIHKLS
jgi:lipoyl(octanoyl) transferase